MVGWCGVLGRCRDFNCFCLALFAPGSTISYTLFCIPAAHPPTVAFASLPSADPVSAMASALAVISGYTEGITAKSLLTSAEGYQTLLFKSDIPIKASQLVR